MFFKHISAVSTLTFLFLSLTNFINAQSWTQLSPTGSAPARDGHSAIYDSANNRMVIFGGYDEYAQLNNDVWVLSNANGLGTIPLWTQLTCNGSAPAERFGHTAVYDNINNRMIIFAGAGNIQFNDVWVLSNANGLGGNPAWSQLFPTGSLPPGGWGPTAVYDSVNNQMIIVNESSVWVLSHANGLGGTPAWIQLNHIGFPGSKSHSSAVYDGINNLMTIYGGFGLDAETSVWVLSNANGLGGTAVWNQLYPSGSSPLGRLMHTSVYDITNNQMTIFGGVYVDINGSEYLLNDVWVLSHANGLGGTPTWTQLSPVGNIPPVRELHSAVYDNINNRMILFGGYEIHGASSDTWVLNDANGLLPPIIPFIPSLKLFLGQSISHAFNLEDFNTGDMAITYSILSNFLDLSSLDSSSVNQAEYSSATTGTNIYLADNPFGESTATNKVKYSTYKIYKLPKVGLTAGSSWNVNVANYTYSSSGIAIPASFGNPDALTVSDSTLISATWLGNTVIHITSLQAFSGAVNVDVIASPNASSPFGIDIDKERIQIYSNLIANSTFSTSNDTAIWSPMEIPPGRSTMASQQWITNHTDAAGTQATGVWKFTFADSNGGVKATPGVSNWINITNGQWYTFRIRLVADTPNNSHTALLFGYTNLPGAGTQTDIVGNVLFGVPTVWTWQEVPLLAHGSSTTGYPQFQFKAGGAGSIYVDEIQIINAAPTLLNARSNTKSHYLYGQFTAGSDTTGWGQQLYFGAGSAPNITVNNGLVLNFAGATSGSGQEGIKWTANNGVPGASHAYSFPVKQNYDMNVGLTLSIQSGNFNSLGIVLAAAYGVQTSGQQEIGTPPSNLIATAGVGVLNSGTYSAEGVAINPYYQGQFGIRSDKSGILVVSNVDVNVDNDDPNFGDAALFP